MAFHQLYDVFLAHVGYFHNLVKSYVTYIFLCLFGIVQAGSAQSLLPANSTYDVSYQSIYDTYSEKIGQSARIYTGHEYANEDYLVSGNPFLIPRFERNSVVYDGILYNDVSLMYDIYRQQLVVSPPEGSGDFQKIALDKEAVTSFELDNKKYVYIKGDSSYINHPGRGYFEILHEGSATILARREKKTGPNQDGPHQYQFYRADAIFILDGKNFTRIKSKKEARSVFADAAKELKAYAKRAGIQRDPLEDYFVSLARQYDNQ